MVLCSIVNEGLSEVPEAAEASLAKKACTFDGLFTAVSSTGRALVMGQAVWKEFRLAWLKNTFLTLPRHYENKSFALNGIFATKRRRPDRNPALCPFSIIFGRSPQLPFPSAQLWCQTVFIKYFGELTELLPKSACAKFVKRTKQLPYISIRFDWNPRLAPIAWN